MVLVGYHHTYLDHTEETANIKVSTAEYDVIVGLTKKYSLIRLVVCTYCLSEYCTRHDALVLYLTP